jgi:nucleoside phosphorylase
MTSPAPPANRDYTVGWICALPIEMAAAKGMLDENYGKPNEQDDSDKNNYCLGRIGKHNVVIACLPNGVYGTTSAAIVASQMLCSFTSVKIGLMVGIGGGVPSEEHDIRLGDVVVSKPGQKFGGVVQYDFGKTLAGGEFIQTGSLNKPPQVLLTATASLETDHEMEESKIPQFLSHMVERYPKMQTAYSYQGAEHDLLYRAGYDHIGNNNACEHCDISNKEERSIRDDNCPVIHYGTIASGNQVMKHGATRDRLREKLNVLCFEMEAAGLMDNFPCLVVRGICDYADSHKNKRWQKYAAATAAAYAKELLEVIPAAGIEKIPKIVDVLSGSKSVQTPYPSYEITIA